MAEKSIEDRVKEIIVEQLGVNPEQVTPAAKFIEDLGADSLDTVELVMFSRGAPVMGAPFFSHPLFQLSFQPTSS